MRAIQSLARGLQIIDLIASADEPVNVKDVADELDVDKSTASRLIGTLESYGYVQRARDSRAYTMGKRLHSISWQLTNRFALRDIARPYLVQLAAQTGECAHIGVYSEGKALVTDDIQPEISQLRVVSQTGRLLHLHNTALGKGLLAFGDLPMPDALPRITPVTITNREQLIRELDITRQRGYALDDEENEYGVRCMAAPIYNAVGLAIATIGISGPTVRVHDQTIDMLAKAVMDTAEALSCELGYQPDEILSP